MPIFKSFRSRTPEATGVDDWNGGGPDLRERKESIFETNTALQTGDEDDDSSLAQDGGEIFINDYWCLLRLTIATVKKAQATTIVWSRGSLILVYCMLVHGDTVSLVTPILIVVQHLSYLLHGLAWTADIVHPHSLCHQLVFATLTCLHGRRGLYTCGWCNQAAHC